MNIILVSNRMSKAASLGPSHLWWIAVEAMMAMLGLLTTASWAT